MAARKKSEEPSINIDEVLTDEELKAVANESEPAERKAKPEDGPRTVVVAEDEAVNRMDLVACWKTTVMRSLVRPPTARKPWN